MPVKFGQTSIRFWFFLSYLITTVTVMYSSTAWLKLPTFYKKKLRFIWSWFPNVFKSGVSMYKILAKSLNTYHIVQINCHKRYISQVGNSKITSLKHARRDKKGIFFTKETFFTESSFPHYVSTLLIHANKLAVF